MLYLPTVITEGKFPGKLIVPKEGPSFPDETIIKIPFWTTSSSLFFINSSLKLIPPKDRLIISSFSSIA